MKKCRLIFFFIDLALRLLFIDLHFFIATIQIGVIVQVCSSPVLSTISTVAVELSPGGMKTAASELDCANETSKFSVSSTKESVLIGIS